ncbi:MAG: universal stress protein [Desulfovibrio sp.]
MIQKILLATHGTPGARRAEKEALRWAKETGAELSVLMIMNEDWKHMTGDDWLNTSTTRNKFGDYVTEQVNYEMDLLQERLEKELSEVPVTFIRRGGNISEVLCETAKEVGADIIIIGAFQSKQAPGFKARFDNKKLHPLLPCPLVIAP